MSNIAIQSRSFPTMQEAEAISAAVHDALDAQQIPNATFTLSLEDEDDEGGVVAVVTDIYSYERSELVLLSEAAWTAGREINLAPETVQQILAVVEQGPDSFSVRFSEGA